MPFLIFLFPLSAANAVFLFCVAGVKDSRLYSCPIYKKPTRTDVNYIAAVDLKTSLPPEYWILRGVALLCDVK
uniref:Dynein heavy chain C-terminal domain-containing protein n=2 Tax=Haplochromini TaxID=319058 RepID=A0A3B4FLL6_9CICH